MTTSAGLRREFKNVSSLLSWNRRVLLIAGIWPLENTYIRTTIWTIYLAVHLCTEYAELTTVFGNLELLVLSVLESVMQSMVFAKLIVFRHSQVLRKLIELMQEDLSDEFCADSDEIKIYLKYNYMGKLYFKISMPYIIFGASMYFFRPLLTNLLIGGDGDNLFELPFRIKIFFTVNDTLTYYLVYFYQLPMIYLLLCHNAWICLLITIVLHICGQLAIVEHRIRHIKVMPGGLDNTNIIFRELVERHMRSVWMAKALDDAFHFVLLLDLVGTTLLLGLMSYVVIIGSNMSESSFGYVYIVCVIATIFLLYGYCIVGELLIQESKRVHAAYYECIWYESSINFRKSLMICMMQTQEPLRMTAGKFFVFSLTGFTDVLRSAMGYLSMLRKMTH